LIGQRFYQASYFGASRKVEISLTSPVQLDILCPIELKTMNRRSKQAETAREVKPLAGSFAQLSLLKVAWELSG
jgi:hypothetical protein